MATSDAPQSPWFRIELSPGPSTESSVSFWRRGGCKQRLEGMQSKEEVWEQTPSIRLCPSLIVG